MKNVWKIIRVKCSPVPAPPPPKKKKPSWGWVMGSSPFWVQPSPVHSHEGAPMHPYCNFFIFEAKSLICCLVGQFLLLSRGLIIALFWCQVCFRSSAVVNLHFSCPNSASVFSSCYSGYQLTWNCLQLEYMIMIDLRRDFTWRLFSSRSTWPLCQISPLRTFTNVWGFV